MCACKEYTNEKCTCGQRTPLKLEVGKTYVDVGGSKVKILGERNNNQYPIIGLYNNTKVFFYTRAGHSGPARLCDLVAEYKEPVYVYFNLYGYADRYSIRGRTSLTEAVNKADRQFIKARIRLEVNTGKVEQLPL